jgi:autotransporter-associated beta strand protein
VTSALTALLCSSRTGLAQQNPNDQTVFHNNTNDTNSTSTTFNAGSDGGAWNASIGTFSTTPYTNTTVRAASSAPAAGYAYVVTGSAGTSGLGASVGGQMRTPTSGNLTFGGDSLTLIPFNGQANLNNSSTTVTNPADQTAGLFFKGASGQSITVNNLVLANGGAVIDFNNTNEVINGSMYFVPAGTTLDGITTTTNGGILDPRTASSTTSASQLTVNSTFAGTGQVHVLETYNGVNYFGAVVFNSSNPSFTGGVNLDNTTPFSSTTTVGTSSYPLLEINKPSALGTGTFTITSVGAGPTISNGTGSAETLSTNMPMQWNGSFNFGYNSSAWTNVPAYTTSALNLGTGTATLGANTTITTNYSTLTVGGNITSSGSYTLTAAGAGTLNLSGGSIAVPLNVSSGTVIAASATSVYSGQVTVYGSGILELTSTSTTFTNAINVNSGGTLALPVGSTGALFNDPAVVSFASGSAANFAAGSYLGLDTTAGDFTLYDNLNGNFGLNKIGPNVLTLTGADSFGGPLQVNAGALILSGNTTLSTSAGITVASGAALDLFGNSPQITTLSGGGNITNNGSTGSVLTVTAASNFSGNITSGTASTGLDINLSPSTAVLTLTGTNTYTGVTTLQSGIVNIGGARALSNTSGTSIVFNGGTLQFSSAYTGDPSSVFSSSSGAPFNIDTNGQNINFSSGLLNGNGLNKIGAGSLYLRGSGTNLGAVTITAGTLELAATGGLYNSIAVNSGTTLALLVGGTNSNGVAQLSSSDITYILGNTTFSSGSTLAIDTSNANASTGFTYAGSITGPEGLNKLGPNTLYLTGSNSWTGPTTVSAGSLVLGSGTILSSSNPLTLASGATLDLGGVSTSIPQLSGSGTVTNSGAAATLTITTAGNTFAGNISNGAGTVALTLAAPATSVFTLTGSNNYSGPTTLSSGILDIGGAKALSNTSGTSIVFNGGTLQFSSSYTGDPSALFNASSSASYNLDTNSQSINLSTGLVNSNGLDKIGAGTLYLRGAGTNLGPVTINGGTLELAATGGVYSSITANSGTTLALAVGGNNPNGVAQLNSGDITTIITSATFNSGSTLAIDSSNASSGFTYTGNISGSFGFTKLGSNTLTLSGTNNLGGSVLISAGTLQLGANTTLSGAAPLNISSTGTLDLAGNSLTVPGLNGPSGSIVTNSGPSAILTVGSALNSTFAGAIKNTSSGTTGLTVVGSGTLTLSGTNTYAGPTNLSSGTLDIGAASALSSVTQVYFTGGTFQFSSGYTANPAAQFATSPNQLYSLDTNAQNVSIGSLNSLGGSLSKLNSGVLTLTGTNTYSGATTVNAGTLQINLAAALNNTSGVVVAIGGSLLVNDNSGFAGLTGASGTGAPITATLYGTGAGGLGALRGANSATDTWAGAVSVPNTATISGGSAGTLNVTGVIGGNGPVAFSSNTTSTTILSNSNTYTGETQIATPSGSTSTLKLGTSNAINVASGLNFTGAGAGTFDTNGYSTSVAYLTGPASATITNSGASNSVLSVTQISGSSTTYAGAINDGATSKLSVVYNGAGNQILSGASNYSGGTTISAGTVTASSSTALGKGVVTLGGGTLALQLPAGSATAPVITGFSNSGFTVNTANTPGVANGIAGSTLTLTDNTVGGQITSAFSNTPVSLSSNGFTTSFQFTVTPRTDGSHFVADGVAFVLQGVGPTAIGGGASGFGYSGIGNSAALALNIYSYPGTEGSAYLTNGVTSGATFNNFDSNMDFISSVTTFNVSLTYNPSAQTLTESMNVPSGTTYTYTYTGVNIAAAVGSNSAYVGFTGSTGYDYAGQSISNFNFSNFVSGPTSIANNVVGSPSTSSVIQLSVASGFTSGSIGSLSIGNNAQVSVLASSSDGVTNHGVLTVTGLTLSGTANAWTGKLDLSNNALDVQNGNLTLITNQLKEGYANGSWQGSGGIVSSAAAADATHLTALGVILNTVDGTTPLYGSGTAMGLFSGISPAATDVLIKYTYYGDTDLSGVVDGSDYSRIDNAFEKNLSASLGSQLTGWFNGDFNYDGVIDGSDYTLIDNAFNSQGASLSATVAALPTAQIGGTSAVPEPASVGLITATMLGLLSRRRRK